MADPTKYTPEYSYSGWQATNPSRPLPADEVDNDFANVSRSVNQTIDALKDVRRSDGKLKNQSVGPDQLSPALSIGFTFTGTWIDGQSYSAGDGVVKDDTFYSARIAHTADVSNAPGNTAYWNELFSLNDIVVTGGMALPRDSFVGDGVTKDFPLSFTPLSKFNLFVQVGGVVQGTDAYSSNGNTLSFISPPPNGYGIEVRGFATVSALVTPEDGSVTTVKLADQAVTLEKLSTSLQTTVNGAMQKPTYDPTNVAGDAFRRDNFHSEDGRAGFLTKAAAQAWSPKAGASPAYLRIYSATAPEYGGGAVWVKVASEPAHNAKFSVTEEGGAVVWYELTSPVPIDPRIFGGRGRGDDADAAIDSQAINDAWDRAAQLDNNLRRVIDLGKAQWVVDEDFDFTGIHHVSMIGLGAGATMIRSLALDAGSLFLMGNQGFKARDFRVEMPDALNTTLIERHLFNFDRPDGEVADIDCQFENVEFSRAYHHIRHRGRGLKVQDCLFSVGNIPIDWGWKNAVPGASPNYTPGAATAEDMGGARGIIVQNSRFHSNTAAWFRNNGDNKHKLAGLEFNGNVGDIGRTMVETSGRWLLISGNKCDQATGDACIKLLDGTFMADIIGNTFGGSQGLTTERDPDNFVQIRGNTEHVSFIGNQFYRCTGHGFDVRDGVTTKFHASKNKMVLPCTDVGSFSPFTFVGAGHTGEVYHNDIDTPSALGGVVRTTDASANIEVGSHKFWNATVPLAVGSSLKYHATLAEKGTWTPQLQFGGANSGMVATTSGKWTRNGDTVVVSYVITLTTKGASTGAATISGLAAGAPLTVPGNANSVGSVMATGVAGLTSTIQAQMASSGQIDLYDNGATGRASLEDTNFANGSIIRGSISYHVS